VIAHLAETHPVRDLCRLLDVPRSTYYAWRRRTPGRRAREDAALSREIKRIHKDHRGVYGSRRVLNALKQQGRLIGRRRTARLMKEQGLQGAQKRRWRPRTTQRDPQATAFPNRLDSIEVARPNQAWAADITYIPTRDGWLYLAAAMDLCSRRITGWALGERMPADLVVEAFRRAAARQSPPPGLIHHSDRGGQYTSREFAKTLASHKALGSMGRTGTCYDNAAMESFWASLKTELIGRRVFESLEQARLEIFDYIETFYNTRRLHSALGYKSPADYETQYLNLSTPRRPVL